MTIQERDKMTLDEEQEEEKKKKIMEERKRTSRKVYNTIHVYERCMSVEQWACLFKWYVDDNIGLIWHIMLIVL